MTQETTNWTPERLAALAGAVDTHERECREANAGFVQTLKDTRGDGRLLSSAAYARWESDIDKSIVKLLDTIDTIRAK